jgi:hypothetical protein
LAAQARPEHSSARFGRRARDCRRSAFDRAASRPAGRLCFVLRLQSLRLFGRDPNKTKTQAVAGTNVTDQKWTAAGNNNNNSDDDDNNDGNSQSGNGERKI